MIVTIGIAVAGLLAAVELIRSRFVDLVAWAVVILAVALLIGRL